MAERKTPVEPSAPVERPTRRGRRKLENVEAAAAKAAVKTTSKANEVKTQARTRTAVLTEQERQQTIKDRQKSAAAKKRRARNIERWADFKTRLGAAGRAAMVVGPIGAPMSIAWTGQIGFANGVLEWPFVGGVGYAAAYELSIIFCAWMYHEARKDGDSGTYYRALTWAFAIGNGVQQWWHWADNWHATPRSVTYSIMTMVGILIWEAYAKLIHRRKLRADGKLSGARPRIGLVRWLRYTRISWTAWSGSVRHGFDEFNDMWIWAEMERERGRTRKDKLKEARAELRDLRQQLADLTKSTPDPTPIVAIERVSTSDPTPISTTLLELEAGSEPTSVIVGEVESGSQLLDPADPDPDFVPTPAEIQAVREMADAGIRLNRQNVMDYLRDQENRTRLGQPEGIATARAAEVAKWGRDQGDGLRAAI